MERLGVNSELHQFIVNLLTDKEVSVSIVFCLYLSMCVDVCLCILKYGLTMRTCLLACLFVFIAYRKHTLWTMIPRYVR